MNELVDSAAREVRATYTALLDAEKKAVELREQHKIAEKTLEGLRAQLDSQEQRLCLLTRGEVQTALSMPRVTFVPYTALDREQTT